ncbi:MFS transporter [Nocardia aurantia]|uniref:MFS transporter n=1 Tax=Nocardia aurantia TaxID=2585199 RepID=A0A7K0DRQ5_9NOCA|nr:MFS transporter [Nocardia aurantia]MQY28227.1 hypothetical protein [Nocardia aurantia]
MFSVLPPAGPQRTLTLLTATTAVSNGIYLSTVVLYFTRIVRMSSGEVGLGLSVAGAVCVLACVLAGKLSDRYGPLGLLRISLLVESVALLALLAVHGFRSYVFTVPFAAASLACGQLMIATVVGRTVHEKANEFRAYNRAVLNGGFAVGATMAAVAAQQDSATIYRIMMVAAAIVLGAAVLLTGRLPRLGPVDIPGEPAPPSGWMVLRDRPYLALTAVDAVLSLQYRIQTVVIPLWILSATTAPRWSVAAVDILNIVIVVLLQVRAGRGVDTARGGGRALARAGVAFLVACAVLPLAHGRGPWLAVAILTVGTAVLTVGELWQTVGGFEVSNRLAPPHALGQYLGVFGTGVRLADSFGPVLLTWLCIQIGVAGWYVVGAILLLTGLLGPVVVGWAERTGGRIGSAAVIVAARPVSAGPGWVELGETITSSNSGVVVRLDPEGRLRGLAIDPEAFAQGPDRLSERILAASRHAMWASGPAATTLRLPVARATLTPARLVKIPPGQHFAPTGTPPERGDENFAWFDR